MAESLETSRFTGAKDRIDDLRMASDRSRMSDHDWERTQPCPYSGWMSPIEIDEAADPIGRDTGGSPRRASEKGFLSISLGAYLELLDWTGREIQSGKRGVIPEHLASILTRLGLDSARWCDLVSRFGRYFKRAVGTAEHLKEEAARRGQRWLQSPGCLA